MPLGFAQGDRDGLRASRGWSGGGNRGLLGIVRSGDAYDASGPKRTILEADVAGDGSVDLDAFVAGDGVVADAPGGRERQVVVDGEAAEVVTVLQRLAGPGDATRDAAFRNVEQRCAVGRPVVAGDELERWSDVSSAGGRGYGPVEIARSLSHVDGFAP